MKNIIRTTLLAVLAFIALSCTQNTDNEVTITPEKQFLKEWRIESSTQITNEDSEVSSDKFDVTKWTEALVPTTVLRALVKAGIYPDPHFDLNNFKIPDANDEMNKRFELEEFSHLKGISNPFKDPYWFRTEFISKGNANKKTWLNFDGINYRADVWVNGHKIADAKDMVGMFTRFKFDITDYVKNDAKNVLAVKIHQVDHTGNAFPGRQLDVFGAPRGQGKDIFKDATLKFSAGWDCAPVIRDRNMGIYQDVFLTYTNAVDIIDPYIVTKLPLLPDTTSANITISAELVNTSKEPVKGVLKGSIDMMKEVDFYTYVKTMPGTMETITFEKEITIEAGKTVTATINPQDFPQLTIKNPYLWWPNNYGMQYLHTLKLEFEIEGVVSDVENTTFGIRQIDSSLKEIEGEFGRIFYVNGRRIFSKGGWLQPDMMLDMNKKRMYDEARLLANANVNVIANEDMPSPPNHVMETYDKYGLMMWETFFQCWTSYPGTASFANPVDTELAIKGAEDIIKRYRNHASLSMYTLQVETIVREEIYTPVRDLIFKLDKTRPFVPTTSYGWDVDKLTPYMSQDLPTGMTDEGAPDYTWYPHDYYYTMVEKVHQQMFRNEMGVPSVPTYTSMEKFIFDLGEGEKNDVYPLDKNWAHHGAWDQVDGVGYVYQAYDVALRERFGKPSTAKDYIRKAQYINAGSYRAMYEAANHRMWDITTGVMLWKLNSTWPTVVWQIYDWFLNPTSAYYYTKKALEPLHIQLNEHNKTVSIINTQHKKHSNLVAKVSVLNFDLSLKWEKEEAFTMEEDRYKELFQLPDIEDLSATYFVKLELKNTEGVTVSDNFYWFSSNKQKDFSDLAKLKKTDLNIIAKIEEEGEEIRITVTAKNTSGGLAFFNRLMITKGEGGDEVLPTFWSDNFFSLLPGEEKVVTARFAKKDLEGKLPLVVIDKN
ncbi:MAG: beta galactosidase jelly roll domain-containing protein [Cyclobacteriaceae bacterium]|nr:beta galactosidase jelly roll domain-containing protein [Cyclobacteriaceae bacterium]